MMKSKSFAGRRGLILIAVAILVAVAAVPVTRQIRTWMDSAQVRDASHSLRDKVFRANFEGAVAEWKQLPPRVAEAPEVKAWYLCALNRVGYAEVEEAVRLAQELTVKQPSSHWSWFALGTVYDPGALEASEKALKMMPGDPDFVWMRAEAMFHGAINNANPTWSPADTQQVEKVLDFVDDQRRKVANPASLLVVKAAAQYFLGTQVHHDRELVAAAHASLEEARRADPSNYTAHSMAGRYLVSDGEPEKALPLLEQAVSLAPDSIRAHTGYWNAFKGLDPSERSSHRQAIEKDVDAAVARNPHAPWLLTRGAMAYFDLGHAEKGRDLEERVLREFPDTVWQDHVASNRLERIVQKLGLWNPERDRPSRDGLGPKLEAEEIPLAETGLDQEMSGDFREFLWSYIENPGPKSEAVLPNAYVVLLEVVKGDPDVDGKKLVRLAQGLADHNHDDPQGVIELANRGIALDRAEEIARVSLDRAEQKLAKKRGDPEAIYLQFSQDRVAELRDALGWVLLKRGRIEPAERELELANEMRQGDRNNLYHRAEVALARGDLPRSENLLAECALMPPANDNPCVPALKDLYQRHHPDMAGYEDYAQAVLGKGNALRKERLLASRLPGRPILPFRFKSLDGTTLSSDDLKGKVAVIDFWGVWCHSCIIAMPEFQKLVDEYRDDREVAIVSVDTFDSVPALEKFLKKNALTLPVLLEDDYVDRAKIDSYPTAWFLDRKGFLRYSASGSGNLVEEYSWLIEDLKRR